MKNNMPEVPKSCLVLPFSLCALKTTFREKKIVADDLDINSKQTNRDSPESCKPSACLCAYTHVECVTHGISRYLYIYMTEVSDFRVCLCVCLEVAAPPPVSSRSL